MGGACNDPAREFAANAGGVDDALRVEARRDEQLLDLGRLADQERGVGREALGRRDEAVVAGRAERGHRALGGAANGGEVVVIVRERRKPLGRDLADRTGDAVRLERAHEQPTRLVTDVVAVVDITQHR